MLQAERSDGKRAHSKLGSLLFSEKSPKPTCTPSGKQRHKHTDTQSALKTNGEADIQSVPVGPRLGVDYHLASWVRGLGKCYFLRSNSSFLILPCYTVTFLSQKYTDSHIFRLLNAYLSVYENSIFLSSCQSPSRSSRRGPTFEIARREIRGLEMAGNIT